IANALIAQGLQRAERVVLLCENSVEAFLLKLGIAKADMVVVPINPVMAADMVAHLLDLLGVRAAIADCGLWERGKAPFEQAGTRLLCAVGAGGDGPAPGFDAFVDGQSGDEPQVRIHGDDIWEILPTSGTTSMPKAVMVSHTFSYLGAMGNAMSFSRGVDIECNLRTCSFLPVIYHVTDHTMGLAPLLCGGSAVIGRRYDAAAIARAVTAEQPTCLWGGSPALVKELVREVDAHPDAYDLSSLTVLVYGWGAIDPAVNERVQALTRGALLVGIFGQTEAIAFHRFWPARWSEIYERTAPAVNYVGIPSPLLGSTVMDEQGESLRGRPGVAGEAVYRSPTVTPGYYRDEAATAEAFKHGWFHSGDMCQYDETGLRIMVDRYKDMIKSGGENVASLRVEAVLAQHPAVRQAAVVGLPDERWGEQVTGVVVLWLDQHLDEAGLIAFCRERLAGFETPKRIVAVDDLPVTVGGKVLKYKLRQLLASE
ncbi:MAG: AMP-binding protein, partial [Salinisphaera sp.]|nr:AMP-binding protein [Salinisphaera sp.]